MQKALYKNSHKRRKGAGVDIMKAQFAPAQATPAKVEAKPDLTDDQLCNLIEGMPPGGCQLVGGLMVRKDKCDTNRVCTIIGPPPPNATKLVIDPKQFTHSTQLDLFAL